MSMNITISRVYDLTYSGEGYRLLVDRVWPRGISKESLRLDEWCPEIAPTTALRKWFAHDPARWEAFRKQYKQELASHANIKERLRRMAQQQPIILLYSAKDNEHNQAVVLKEWLIAG
jgi:uncharacterized protein YeaO (DUF488 family)